MPPYRHLYLLVPRSVELGDIKLDIPVRQL